MRNWSWKRHPLANKCKFLRILINNRGKVYKICRALLWKGLQYSCVFSPLTREGQWHRLPTKQTRYSCIDCNWNSRRRWERDKDSVNKQNHAGEWRCTNNNNVSLGRWSAANLNTIHVERVHVYINASDLLPFTPQRTPSSIDWLNRRFCLCLLNELILSWVRSITLAYVSRQVASLSATGRRAGRLPQIMSHASFDWVA